MVIKLLIILKFKVILKHLNKLFLLYILTEELQKQLVEQVELRKKLEREFQNLKGRLFYVSFLSYVFFAFS